MGDSGLFVSRVVLGVANLSDTINQLPDNGKVNKTERRVGSGKPGRWILITPEKSGKGVRVEFLRKSEGGSLPLPFPLI